MSRNSKRIARGLSALALAASALAAPGVASAQDRGHRDGGSQGGRGAPNSDVGRALGDYVHSQPEYRGPHQRVQPQQAPAPVPQRQAQQGRPDVRGDRDGRNWQSRDDAQREAWRNQNGRRDGNGNDGRGNWRGNPQQPDGWRDGRRPGDGREAWRRDGRDNQWRGDQRRGDQWRGDRDGRRWDRNWRSNNRYDWSSYRSHNRNIFRGGRYYSPYRDYSYRRVGIGITLGSLFYGQQYWIDDPWSYRLPEVYGPYRWVRYYDDVVLVDVYTGEVVDVIYDFFW